MKQIFLDFAEITIYDNGIFHFHYIGEEKVTLEQIKMVTELRWKYAGKENGILLASTETDTALPNEETINYLYSEEHLKTVRAHAYVISGLSQQLAFRAVKMLKQPSVPTQSFKNIDEAMEWLMQFVEKK